ncbi:hypothetical protein ACQ5SO_13935 [Rhodovulum sp. DZ06]|uniref:hypothetical protein n=1 Tax=Rhodovulum sp. DZ06 TaxID=3425126 RepID=UPI003D336E86
MANKQLRAAADQVATVLSMVMRGGAGEGGGKGAEMALRRAQQVLAQAPLQSAEVRGAWKMDAGGLHRRFAQFVERSRASSAPLQQLEKDLEALQADWARGGGGASAGKHGTGGGAGKATFQDLSMTKVVGDGMSHKVKYGSVKYGWKGSSLKWGPRSVKTLQDESHPVLEAVFGLQWAIVAGHVLLRGDAQGVKYERTRVIARMQDEVADARAASA